MLALEEVKQASPKVLASVYHKFSKENVYDYDEHVALCEELDKQGKLSSTYMMMGVASTNDEWVWDDIRRERTLNVKQVDSKKQQHICPLQIDIVERIINRYSNKNEVVYDPFGGIMTVPYMAVKMGRYGMGCELNTDYFHDGVEYCEQAEQEIETPTLFDFMEAE